MIIDRRGLLAGGALALIADRGIAAEATLGSEIDAYIAPFVQARDFSGVILIQRADRVLYRKAHGFMDFASRAPMRTDARVAIGSIGKVLTMGALYALEDQGRVGLDDPLAKWMPSFPQADAVTLRMIANHRSGLARDLENFQTGRMTPRTLAQLMPLVASQGYATKPGEAYGYSNNGYRVLGRVVELSSGETYHAAVDRLVLRPHRMADTGPLFGGKVARLATGYWVGPEPLSLNPPLPLDFSNWQGAGSFYSTVDDLAKLAGALPFRPPKQNSEGRQSAGHDGLGHGYMACCYRFPETDTRIIFAGNIESGLFQPLQADLEKIVFGEPVKPPDPPKARIAVAPEALRRFEGRYAIGPSRSMLAKVEDGYLGIDAGDGVTPLTPIADGVFFSRLKYATISFVEKDGEIVRLDWNENGRTFPCERIKA
jgi:CubicO group peptidase (beta-lactamase class C family)